MVGVAAGITVSNRHLPKKFWGLSILCAILPDIDVVSFKLGIPYGHFFGHRGFFHSIFFAFIVGFIITEIFFSKEQSSRKDRWFYFVYFSLVTSTHGIFDAFTNGGLGIALLSPFDNHRYFFWKTPISVSPISPRVFLNLRTFGILANEFLWVWMPMLFLALLGKYGILRKKEIKCQRAV
jgi:inner membrane protein